MRSSHKLFPSGAAHGLPSDKLWVRNISMPTIVSICSSIANRSINSWTGTLPLGSRKYSIRHSTSVTVQDILLTQAKIPGVRNPETLPRTRPCQIQCVSRSLKRKCTLPIKRPLALLSGSLNAPAVGSRPFVETVKGELGLKETYREVIEADRTYALREAAQTYGLKFAAESEALRSQNTVFGMKLLMK